MRFSEEILKIRPFSLKMRCKGMHFFSNGHFFLPKICKSPEKSLILHRRIIKIDCFKVNIPLWLTIIWNDSMRRG